MVKFQNRVHRGNRNRWHVLHSSGAVEVKPQFQWTSSKWLCIYVFPSHVYVNTHHSTYPPDDLLSNTLVSHLQPRRIAPFCLDIKSGIYKCTGMGRKMQEVEEISKRWERAVTKNQRDWMKNGNWLGVCIYLYKKSPFFILCLCLILCHCPFPTAPFSCYSSLIEISPVVDWLGVIYQQTTTGNNISTKEL